MARVYAKKPCVCTPIKKCRTCVKSQSMRRVYETQPPCPACGVRDRSTNGDCRPCGKARQDRIFANQQPCRVCGSRNRNTAGICRSCARNADLKKHYGIDSTEYERMLNSQGGVCAICGAPPGGGRGGKLHVDHCHATDEVRAILCHNCNFGLGAFGDSPSRMRQAARYVETHAARISGAPTRARRHAPSRSPGTHATQEQLFAPRPRSSSNTR